MVRKMFVCLLLLSSIGARAQESPKLVVGIVVDQMRWDYLKYYDYTFGEVGFRRLLSEGYSCDNCMIDYIPTVTAAGHSCIYSGSIPSITGIAGNDFYKDGEKVYCCDDLSVETVGAMSDAGKMSPRNLRVTTMADAVKMAQDFKSKTVGISLKDRGAILPAGHTADAAYWFDKDNGIFVSSTYYVDSLPQWVEEFNTSNRQTTDIRYTPIGNQLVADLAMAAIDAEQLGQGTTTDFLAISFSSTDYIGHKYSTRSPETEDVYRQLDSQLAALLACLDSKVGMGNYLLFLTADHAAAHNADQMTARNIPAGRWMETEELNNMNAWLRKKFDTEHDFVKDYLEYRIYLNNEAMEKAGVKAKDVRQKLIKHLLEDDRVAYAADFESVASQPIPQEIKERIIRGYNPKRSGDIQLILQPGYYGFGDDSYIEGTTHGVWCPYDSHIPLLFMGWRVPNGSSQRQVSVTDIAATICSMLGIQVPSGSVGHPIEF